MINGSYLELKITQGTPLLSLIDGEIKCTVRSPMTTLGEVNAMNPERWVGQSYQKVPTSSSLSLKEMHRQSKVISTSNDKRIES